jgi:hypothetical protein
MTVSTILVSYSLEKLSNYHIHDTTLRLASVQGEYITT